MRLRYDKGEGKEIYAVVGRVGERQRYGKVEETVMRERGRKWEEKPWRGKGKEEHRYDTQKKSLKIAIRLRENK